MKSKNSKSEAEIVAHPNDKTLLNGGTIQSHPFTDVENAKIMLNQLENDLKIFKSSNLEILKSMYNKNIAFVFEKNSWKAGTRHMTKAIWQFKDLYGDNKLKYQSDNDLKIFRSPNINFLKSLVFWQFKGSYNLKKTIMQFGSLKIFRTPNIEIFKSLYYKSIDENELNRSV